MATCSSADSVLDAASQIKSNATKLDTFVNGTASQTVQLGTGDPTPTLRKFVADAQDVVTQAALDAGQTVLDDVAQNKADIAALQSGKADKVAGDVEDHIAALDMYGNLQDSGIGMEDVATKSADIAALDDVKADKLMPAEIGNLAKLSSDGNLRDSGRSAEDFVLLLAYAHDEALDLALLNRMNIEVYDEWYARGISHLNAANIDAMKTVQTIRGLIDAYDESAAQHRLQIRLFDGTNPGASSKPVLFVTSGQSNGVGYDSGMKFDSAEDCGQFWSWKDGANMLKPLKDPTGETLTRSSGWCQFARRFFALTGRKIILLNIGNGGSAVTDGGYMTGNTWADNEYGYLRSSRQTVWNAFNAAVPASSYDLGAILWVQGEEEAARIYAGTVTVQDYKNGTLDVLNWTRTLIGDEDCPVFVGKIGFNGTSQSNAQVKAAYRTVQNAQEELCDGESIFMGFSMAPCFYDAPDAYMSDSIHYNHHGYVIYGNAFARSVVNYLNF